MQEYFEHEGISQSQLKSLLIHPQAWTNERDCELYFEEKAHFIIGSAVDFQLTQPELNFNDYYHVSNVQNKPSDTMKSIIKQVYDEVRAAWPNREVRLISDSQYSGYILDACDSHTYQSRWNNNTRISKVCEGWEYFEDLKLAEGKQVLSQEESDLISEIVMSLRTSEVTSKYFNEENISYQIPIYFKYMEEDCKALLDMVVFDEENMTIQPIDIKTMGDYTIRFPKSLRRRRYDIQAAFYTEALKWLYPEYTILPFKFIVESTTAPGQPLVFTCDETLMNIGKYGRSEIDLYGNVLNSIHGEQVKSYDRLGEIKGFVQLLELYKYYNTNGWDLDQLVRENNSELNIDWSGIII